MRYGPNPDHQINKNVASELGARDGSKPSGFLPAIPEAVTIRVVFQKRRGRHYLHGIDVLESDTGEDVMMKLRAKFNVGVSSFWVVKDRPVTLWKPVIEIGTLSSFHVHDLEAQRQPLEVILSSRTPSAELTAAFYRPYLLRLSGPFALQHRNMLTSSTSGQVLLVEREVNKDFVFWFFCATLVFSICVGLTVGVLCKRADFGIACGAGLVGVIAVTESLLLWMFK